ncbi:DUF2461 domain-containing protein [Williamwhitmania taraxaci]|uniref:TIGR02453 family protein n=1 Tax=Williamwhitmania taraxaci TaxID=1640674 RepID=A0A1G6KZQ4_9BACT|nr:DUF2461 domain-containing protein [Williamwhitmania taraxaci]SDC36311.1 TIGR02453 family protein [Williamwhitmania taraxaci]
MVPKTVMIFLEGLKANNSRDWFNENKDNYLQALKSYDNILEQLISSVGLFDDEVVGLKPKDAIFRIYRDVRFSHDKSPYKTHFGAYLARGGRKSPSAGYYVHLEADGSVLAGGIWRPESENLKKIRRAIDLYHEEFLQIVSEKIFTKWFGKLSSDDALVRVPAGFSNDSPVANYLRMKSFTVGHTFTNRDVLEPNFEERVVEACRAMYRFNTFLREAIDEK